MNKSTGRLESVEIRTVWPHEERDFSVWLAENIDLIGLELGIELRFVARESGVGRFSLDILAHDETNDRNVIIENQLGQTDHDHLGKLLTYAAGNDAHVIIWIARKFLDEHRAALDWLNRTSEPGRSFFGIEIDAVKIGDSLPAPRFKIVSQSNEWRPQTMRATRNSSDDKFFYGFYETLRNKLADTRKFPALKNVTARADYVPFNLRSRIYYAYAWGRGTFTLGLYIATTDPNLNSAIFQQMYANREAVEDKSELALLWDFKEGRQRQQVYAQFSHLESRDDPESMDQAIVWGIAALEKMINHLQPVAMLAIDAALFETQAKVDEP